MGIFHIPRQKYVGKMSGLTQGLVKGEMLFDLLQRCLSMLGSISAVFSSPVFDPPEKERLDVRVADHVCDVTAN